MSRPRLFGDKQFYARHKFDLVGFIWNLYSLAVLWCGQQTVEPGAGAFLSATNCTKPDSRSRNWLFFQAELKGFWQLSNSRPSFAHSTGGDIKEPQTENTTSSPALLYSPTRLWHTRN